MTSVLREPPVDGDEVTTLAPHPTAPATGAPGADPGDGTVGAARHRSRGAVGARVRAPASAGLVLLVILSAQLMVVLDATIVNVALPDIQRELGFSTPSLSWVLNAYTLTFGGLLLLGARAGDLFGRRRTFLVGIAVFALASLLGGFATGEPTLLAARALQGIGGALAAPSSLALLATMFPEGRERMRALGLFTAVSVGGGALGLVAGGVLVQWASWRWVMFVNVPIGVGVFLLGRRVVPATARVTGRFDLPGALSSTLGVGAVVFGFVEVATRGWSDVVPLVSFAAGLVLLAVFVTVERRTPHAITPLRLFADRSRTAANVSRGLVFAGMFGMFFFLTQYLQGIVGLSPLQAGFAFLPMPVTVFFVSQLVARVGVNRVDGKVLALVGIALSTAGLLLASRLGTYSGYPQVLLSLLLFALGNGTSFVPLTSAALARVPAADAGAASGLINVVQQLGGTVGVAVLVTVAGTASRAAGARPGGPRTADGLFVAGADAAFLAATVILLSVFVMVALFVRTTTKADTGAPAGH